MSVYHDQQFSPYGTRQLFDLVADIERYPEFLPWCRAARILSRDEKGCLAELVISYKHMSERYTSRVTFSPPADNISYGAIEVAMTEGPFEYLNNYWQFTPETGGGTRIDFMLDFKFRSRILEKLMGAFFAKATGKMALAFKERANALYGKQRKSID